MHELLGETRFLSSVHAPYPVSLIKTLGGERGLRGDWPAPLWDTAVAHHKVNQNPGWAQPRNLCPVFLSAGKIPVPSPLGFWSSLSVLLRGTHCPPGAGRGPEGREDWGSPRACCVARFRLCLLGPSRKVVCFTVETVTDQKPLGGDDVELGSPSVEMTLFLFPSVCPSV